MSRKNNAFNDNTTAGYAENEDESSAALGGETFDDEEETVDISQFAAPHISAESEEGKKVAQLMESLLFDSAAVRQSSTALKQSKPKKEKAKKEKPKKEKKSKKGFGLFSPELPKSEENDYEFPEDEPLDSDTYDEEASNEISQSEPTATEDDYYYQDDYSNTENEQEAVEDYDTDNDYEYEYEYEEEVSEAPDKTAQSEPTASEDDYYYEDDYSDIEDEQEAVEDYDIDDDYEYEEEAPAASPASEPEEAAQNNSEQASSENEEIEDEEYDDDYDPSPYYANSGKFINKHPFLQKLKAFWTSSEDFEEKFDDDFDPSVFDEEESGSNKATAENDDEAVSTELSEENSDYSDEENKDEIESSAEEDSDTYEDDYVIDEDDEELEPSAEEDSDTYEDDYIIDEEYENETDSSSNEEEYSADDYDEDEQSLAEQTDAAENYDEEDIDGEFEDELEYELERESHPKKKSILDKFKSFWQGDDLSDEKLNEEITEEDIDAELRADGQDDKAQWGKSSVTYDDLSEYAPKPRSSQSSAQAEDEEEPDENVIALEQRPRRSLLDTVKTKLKAVLTPSVTSTDGMDDEGYSDLDDEEEFEPAHDEITDGENELKAVKVSKPSPIDHFKNFWNDDGDYADEDDEDEDEDEEPVDAEYNDEESPVVSKPVLKVIHPFDKHDETEDEVEDTAESETNDEAENEAESEITEEDKAEIEDESTSQPIAQAVKEDIAPDDDDEIISEGPDAPDDVYSAPSHRAKHNIFGTFGRKLKTMWNGGEDDKTKASESKDAPLSEEKHKFADKVRAEAQQAIDDELSQRSDKSAEQPAAAQQPAEPTSPDVPVEPEINSTDNTKAEPAAESEQPSISAAETEQQIKSGPEVPTFDDIAQNKTQIDNLDGKQVIDGKVIPDYTHEDLVEKINLTNENLSMVVRREYEEYIKQSKYRPVASEIVAPEVNSEVSRAVKQEMRNPEEAREKSQQKLERSAARAKQEKQEQSKEKRQRRSLKDVLFGEVENSADFSEFRAQTNQNRQNEQVIEDYDKPSDARAIRAEINYDNRKISFRCITLTAIFLVTLVLFIIQRYFPTILTDNIPNADIMTCLLSLILLLVSAVLCHSTVIGGLKPLLAFKGNSDTAIAVAVVGCAVQGIVSFFDPQSFFSGGMHLYSILAIAALLLNSLGKMCIVQRIRDNFKFVSSPNRKYSARIFEDEEIAGEMISKTEAEKPIIALQSRTRFLKGFLKFSYMPDPSERAASIMAPITTVIAVLVAIICGISTSSPAASVSAFSIVACMGVPMCCLLAINIPMKKLCREALRNRAMIVGYPAVKHFSDTRAVMVDSRELYPRGKVELLSVKTFNTYNIDKALLNAAAVMKIANTPMTYMFEDVISEKGEQLPEVESVKYEDGKGLVSWVGGERLLLGNRELMAKYSINLPSVDFEESSVKSRTNCITYLANAGQLVAMLVTDYQPDRRLAAELKRLEDNGVTILIRTADPNVSQLKVAKDYRIYMRSIKILPTVLGNICKDEMSRRDENSKAVLATEGRLHSLARAIGGCIKVRSNLFISIVIQIIAVALGVLIASIVSLFSGLQGLSGLDLLLYVIFWTVATIIAPLIRKA